jgi:mannose-6-phosphate isomerase-like protein (cupin superfamily)
MYKLQTYKLTNIQTQHSQLIPLELKNFIDFEVKRIYFAKNFNANTNAHCHKIEKELFTVIKGQTTATVDNGQGIKYIKMSENEINCIYIDNYVWHQFINNSSNLILLALSSTNYSPDRSDYIENYQKFQKIISQK